MNQKINLQNRVLAYGLGSAVLILGIGLEAHILKQEIQNQQQPVKFESKTEYLIFRQENLIENFNFATLNLETASKIEPENPIPAQQIQNQAPFFDLSSADRYTICCIVAGEAKGESMEGKMAVATCILNAMAKDQISPSEVRTRYKYSGWDADLQNSNPEVWSEVEEAVSRVFDDGEIVSENPILFFYAPKRAKGKWHQTLPHDQIIGNHSFHYLEEDVNADWFIELTERRNQHGN